MGIGGVGMTFTAPMCGRKDGRTAAGDTLGGGSNNRCDGVFLLSMIAIMVLNPLTRIGNACLIHL